MIVTMVLSCGWGEEDCSRQQYNNKANATEADGFGREGLLITVSIDRPCRMWLTPLLLVLATTYAASPPYTVGVDESPSTHEIVSPDVNRLVINAFFLEALDKRLEAIREKLKRASQVDHERDYRELQARLIPLEERFCQKDQFECGHRSAECIFELFVCDGHKDCTNGYDEDEAVCSIEPALAGRTYTGMIHWTGCESRKDHPVNITILGYRIRRYSSSIIWLKGLIDATYQNDDNKQVHISHTAIGHYKFARRQMVLLGEGVGKANAAYCDFNKGDDKRTTCNLVKVASLDHCATMHLQLDE